MFLLQLASLAYLAVCVSGQYFSEGWQPGQPVPSANPERALRPGASPPQGAPGQAQQDSAGLLGAVSGLLEKAGINITKNTGPGWDERVPLITDANYEEMVVNEELMPEEEEERAWFIVVTVTSGQSEGLSKYVDQAFDTAFNETQIENDLPNIRWGRIDYLNVTGVTTRWNVWQAPLYVLATNHGQTLRFYKPRHLRPHAPTIRSFLLTKTYLSTPPWSSPFAPGGPRAWVLDYLAVVLTKIYDVMVRIPRWLLVIVTGASGSVVLNLFHRKPKAPAAQQRRAVRVQAPAGSKTEKTPVSQPTSTKRTTAEEVPESPKPSPKKSKGKKGGKK
ncbi:hypothetical protein OE88DRAFT_1672021 [Heliocybe sulcata]|uniref:Uncharacterized protein n=1 Tax=Heliocybe sulcata TaxID=5364 RepID=A0A5C3NDL3_9AGAM|nr:hypothetical protein OE88DRAFT_1672021 [Heliocybe sulcata]